jgi:hypothetical protein
MTSTVCGHEVELDALAGAVYYKCVDCGLRDEIISVFDRYDCRFER